MLESSATLQHHLERAKGTFDDFRIKMNRYYPGSKTDLGAYILMRLGNEKSGTKSYQKWDGLWTEYCMYLNRQSQANTALANYHHKATSLLN